MTSTPSSLGQVLVSVFRWFVALGFVTTGVLHFTHLEVFLAMMPSYLPWHAELVWISGVFEILGGVGLLIPATRRFSGWGLLALLVAVFPANLNMALNNIALPIEGMPHSQTALWVRLPFQLVLAAEVWLVALWTPAPKTSPHAS